MKDYRIKDAHKNVMPKLQHWCDEASIVHWHKDDDQFPEWQHAYERMRAEGRISKVKNPSPHHQSIPGASAKIPSKSEQMLLPEKPANQ